MKPYLRQLPALASATAAAALTAWMLRYFWQTRLGHANVASRLGEVFVPMIAATALYVALGLWLKVSAAGEIVDFVRRRRVALPGKNGAPGG